MRQKLLLILWLLTDFALFVASYTLAYFLRVGWILSSDVSFEKFFWVAIAVAPIWLSVLVTTRTFNLFRMQRSPKTAAYIAYSSLVGIALFTLSYFFAYQEFFSRLLIVYAFVIHATATWIWHIFFGGFNRLVLRQNPPVFPTLVVGVTRESTALITRMNRRLSPLKPVAVLDGTGSKEKEIDGVPVLGKLNKLEETLSEYGITHLIQCSDLEQSLNLLSACRKRGITYLLLPSVLGIVERDERLESLEGFPVTVVRPQ